jgi:hypothetical protein
MEPSGCASPAGGALIVVRIVLSSGFDPADYSMFQALFGMDLHPRVRGAINSSRFTPRREKALVGPPRPANPTTQPWGSDPTLARNSVRPPPIFLRYHATREARKRLTAAKAFMLPNESASGRWCESAFNGAAAKAREPISR